MGSTLSLLCCVQVRGTQPGAGQEGVGPFVVIVGVLCRCCTETFEGAPEASGEWGH